MRIEKTQSLLSSLLMVAGLAISAQALSADDPTDPSYMTASEKAYWEKQGKAMAGEGGKVTHESFMKYYGDIWDKHLGKVKEPTIERVTEEWMMNDAVNPTDPNFKSHVSRKDHVATMDTNKDGKVSREEFITHMEMHWQEIEKASSAKAVEPDAVAKMLRNSPLDPSYRK